MPSLFRSALLCSLALAAAPAMAQIVIPEPEPMEAMEPAMDPAMSGGMMTEEDARAVAMMNGMAAIEDVDTQFMTGNFEVEGTDAAGKDMEMTIDAHTGAVLEMDD